MYYYNNKIYDQKYTSAEDEVNEFLKRHEATAEISRHRMYARRQPIRYKDWLEDGATIPFDQTVDREPMVEINMPKHRFQDLVERERWVGKLEGEAEYYKRRYLEAVEEDRLRQQHPGVKRAWEHYQTLLNLVK